MVLQAAVKKSTKKSTKKITKNSTLKSSLNLTSKPQPTPPKDFVRKGGNWARSRGRPQKSTRNYIEGVKLCSDGRTCPIQDCKKDCGGHLELVKHIRKEHLIPKLNLSVEKATKTNCPFQDDCPTKPIRQCGKSNTRSTVLPLEQLSNHFITHTYEEAYVEAEDRHYMFHDYPYVERKKKKAAKERKRQEHLSEEQKTRQKAVKKARDEANAETRSLERATARILNQSIATGLSLNQSTAIESSSSSSN